MKNQENTYTFKGYALCLKDLPSYDDLSDLKCFRKGKLYEIVYVNPDMENMCLKNEHGSLHYVASDADDGSGWFKYFDIKKRVLTEKSKFENDTLTRINFINK